MRKRDILFILGALLIGSMFVGVLSSNATTIRFENCEEGTWVGGVRWVDNHTDYEQVPDLELKGTGAIVVDLEPGDYAITHFQPRQIKEEDGVITMRLPAILDFREITVGLLPQTHYFGCEE
jgi:hypothetical protein